MPLTLAEQIANSALDTFSSLPTRCKPRTLPDGRKEWTPISAVSLNRTIDEPNHIDVNPETIKIVSLATGTKSLPASALPKCKGLILHDSHAEILALRAFNYWLLREMRSILESKSYESAWVELMPATNVDHDPVDADKVFPFRLRKGVQISLFTTEAPCGDASMELLIAASEKAGRDVTPWPTTSQDSARLPPGRGCFSNLGALRRKPARADAEVSMSKSCTDKLMLKQFTGLLSFPVGLFVKPASETFLKRLIVYNDQWSHSGYHRAFGEQGRLQNVTSTIGHKLGQQARFFDVDVLPHGFRRSEFAKCDEGIGGQKSRSSNIATVWIAGVEDKDSVAHRDLIEILLNGVKQGFRQFDDRERKGSVLCRRNMLQEASKLAALLRDRLYSFDVPRSLVGDVVPYSKLKSSFDLSQKTSLKQTILDGLGGWPGKVDEDEFDIPIPLLSH